MDRYGARNMAVRTTIHSRFLLTDRVNNALIESYALNPMIDHRLLQFQRAKQDIKTIPDARNISS